MSDVIVCKKCGGDHSKVSYCGSRATGEYLGRSRPAMTPKPPSPTKTTEPLGLCERYPNLFHHKDEHFDSNIYGHMCVGWHTAPSPKPSAEGTPSWRTEMLGDDAPGEAVGRETREQSWEELSVGFEEWLGNFYSSGLGANQDEVAQNAWVNAKHESAKEISRLKILQQMDKDFAKLLVEKIDQQTYRAEATESELSTLKAKLAEFESKEKS